MLKAIGIDGYIDGYYVIVHTGRGIASPDFPTLALFNHAIAAIPVSETSSATAQWPFLKHEVLGNLLLFDPTDSDTPFGELRPGLRNSTAMLVTTQGGEAVTTPPHTASRNRLTRRAELKLSPDGMLTGEVTEIRDGASRASFREMLLARELSSRAGVFEEMPGASVGSFRLTSAKLSKLEEIGTPLIAGYRFEAAQYARRVGERLVLRPRIVGVKAMAVPPNETRSHAVELAMATLESEDILIDLPPGYIPGEIAPPVELKRDFARYLIDGNRNGKPVAVDAYL